jgi:hypothetical protein
MVSGEPGLVEVAPLRAGRSRTFAARPWHRLSSMHGDQETEGDEPS